MEFIGLPMPLSAEHLASLADYTFWATAERAARELDFSVRPVEEVLSEVLEFEMSQRRM